MDLLLMSSQLIHTREASSSIVVTSQDGAVGVDPEVDGLDVAI